MRFVFVSGDTYVFYVCFMGYLCVLFLFLQSLSLRNDHAVVLV